MQGQFGWTNVAAEISVLRSMADGLLREEREAQSLQATGLLLTALRRLRPVNAEFDGLTWANRKQFLAAVYLAMEHALIDHARKRRAIKRHSTKPVSIYLLIDDLAQAVDEAPEQVEALVEAMHILGADHPHYVELVQHRYYSGYTISETALVMKISERTVRRWWEQARLLLHDLVLQILDGEVDNAGSSETKCQ